MRKTIAIMATAICFSVAAHSQTFLDHLQKDDKGGSVSVKQSDDISKLVNGSKKEGGSQQQDQSRAREDESGRAQRHVGPPRPCEFTRRRGCRQGASRAREEEA